MVSSQNGRGEGVTGKTRAQLEVESREREGNALRLRREGLDYEEIAAQVGWESEAGARHAVQRALRRHHEPDVEAFRQIEGQRLSSYMTGLLRELERDHYVVSHGRVVYDRNGEPVPDTMAVVAIYRELRQLSAEYSRLMGLHAPSRVVVEEVTRDMVEAEIVRINALAEKLEAELGEEAR